MKRITNLVFISTCLVLGGCGHGSDVWRVVRSACGVALAIGPDGEIVGPGEVEELDEEAALSVANASVDSLNVGAGE